MKTYFTVAGFYAISEEDNFENGCIGKARDYSESDYRPCADTFDQLLNIIKADFRAPDYASFLLNSCGEEGRLDLQVMQREPFETGKILDASMSAWKEGKRKMYLTCYTFHITQVSSELDLASLTQLPCSK